ncbi:MAG: 4-alpha-glucanotransferase [Ruminococcus sp.]|jgi:4-alpha-glucanotransferase|nr:4-alpha-glucanotransferase [Ruminococcus sp.]
MRQAGVLLHITSLYDNYGIGSLGKAATDFIDFLKSAGISVWQMLPVGPTGFGDSPYQSYSAFAGNPNIIDLEKLIDDGLVSASDPDLTKLSNREFTNYDNLFAIKSKVLHRAYLKFIEEVPDDYENFCKGEAFWLDDYALYMNIKYSHGMKMWTMWEDNLRKRDPEAIAEVIKADSENPTAEYSIGFWKFCQYIFFLQFAEMKRYAAKNRIKLVGDMPIYVSMDSSDIWANPALFELDEDLRPINVAGCPPDDFAKTGQLWGNPVYDWGEHLRTGYKWWISRIISAGKFFDTIRIDHFRGFESFYAIPAGNDTAEEGTWKNGPGAKLFEVIEKYASDNGVKIPSFIAENLGFLTPHVQEMLAAVGYPGMNVLEFGFGGDDSIYLPHNFIANSVSYIGTHDNDTALGWYSSQSKKTKKRVKRYIHKSDDETVSEALIRVLAASPSDLVVFQMQDLLGLGSEARMNTPSTVGGTNWLWQMSKPGSPQKIAPAIHKLLGRYFRLPPVTKSTVKIIKKIVKEEIK